MNTVAAFIFVASDRWLVLYDRPGFQDILLVKRKDAFDAIDYLFNINTPADNYSTRH